MGSGSGSVCAVVVTHDRCVLLREALAALRAQTRAPDHVLVVDNASTDETPDVLRREFPEVEVLRLAVNEGGAGGFHEGMRRAHGQGFEWLWLLDDDTIAAPTALERLLEAPARRGAEDPPPPVLASRVVWDDGRLHPMNYALPRTYDPDDLAEAAERGLLSIRFATFVSLLVHRRAIDHHGLPHKHFFLWSDDIEFTARVLRDSRGYLVPQSVAHHRTAGPHTALDAPPERFYLAVRNALYTVRGPAFTPRERFVHVLGLVASVGAYLGRRRLGPRAVGAVVRGVRDGVLTAQPGRQRRSARR